MPPKTRITKEMILNAVLAITREQGFETVNARSIAGKLSCSTRPVFTCYENMAELKKDFLAFAYEYYIQYTDRFQKDFSPKPYLLLPISYIAFAREEPQLFRLLFINDMDLNMTSAMDFYHEPDNVKRAQTFAETFGLEEKRGRTVFLDFFLYAHGIAVLTASKKLNLDQKTIEQMVTNVLSAFLNQEKGAADT